MRHSFNTLRVNLSRCAGTPYLSPTPLPLVSSCFGLKDCNDTRATWNVSVDARSNGEGVPMQNDLKVHLCCYAHHSHAPYTLSCIEDSTWRTPQCCKQREWKRLLSGSRCDRGSERPRCGYAAAFASTKRLLQNQGLTYVAAVVTLLQGHQFTRQNKDTVDLNRQPTRVQNP